MRDSLSLTELSSPLMWAATKEALNDAKSLYNLKTLSLTAGTLEN
jgi:hypothetical protein